MKRISATALCLLLAAGVFTCAGLLYTAQKSKPPAESYAPLIPHIALQQGDDIYAAADKIRRFVHTNSIHKKDEEFYRTWGDDEKVAALILDRVEGRSATGPHMECSSRSGVTRKILKNLGHRVRGVIIYRMMDNFPAHVFLEVQNPVDGTWFIEDPDYDVFWRIRTTGKRAGIEDLIKMPQEAYEPCLAEGRCGWDIVNDENRRPGVLKGALGLAVITDKAAKDEKTTLVNTARFDLEKKMKVKTEIQSFCEFAKKHCRKIVKF